MGRLITEIVSYETYHLELDERDIEIRKRRIEKKREYEYGKHVPQHVTMFCKRLVPCPECGKTPSARILRKLDDDEYISIKLACERFHISEIGIECGDWHETLAKAGRSWNARARRDTEIIDGKLHLIGHYAKKNCTVRLKK